MLTHEKQYDNIVSEQMRNGLLIKKSVPLRKERKYFERSRKENPNEVYC